MTNVYAYVSDGSLLLVNYEDGGIKDLKKHIENNKLKVICVRVRNTDVGVDDFYENRDVYFLMNKVVVEDALGAKNEIHTIGVGFTDGNPDEVRICWYDKTAGFVREQERRTLKEIEQFAIKNYD